MDADALDSKKQSTAKAKPEKVRLGFFVSLLLKNSSETNLKYCFFLFFIYNSLDKK